MNFPCSSVVITSQTLHKISSFYLHRQFVKSALLKNRDYTAVRKQCLLLATSPVLLWGKISSNWSNRQSDLSPALHICGAKSEFSKHLLSLFLLCCPISHTTTPSSYRLHPLLSTFSPVNTRNLPQLSLPLFFFFPFYLPFLLFELSVWLY